MPKMIQIRNVPEDLHRKLKIRAAEEGMTLSDLLKREARRLCERPTMADVMARLARLKPVKLPGSSADLVREGREESWANRDRR